MVELDEVLATLQELEFQDTEMMVEHIIVHLVTTVAVVVEVLEVLV